MKRQLVPVGSVISVLRWRSSPDKYAGPAIFDTLKQAQAHGPSPVITVECVLDTPDGHSVNLGGGVSSVDSMFRVSPRQQEGVIPAVGAIVVELIQRIPESVFPDSIPDEQSAIYATYEEIVFRNPDGSQFVLLPNYGSEKPLL